MSLNSGLQNPKRVSQSENFSETFKYPEIRLEKIHSKTYRNKHFANCMLLLDAIDKLTSVKTYNYKMGEGKGQKITLGELLDFLNASIGEIYAKYWETYFKVVVLKLHLEKIGYSKEKRTIINRLNWLVRYGYLNVYRELYSKKTFYRMNEENIIFNNFVSLDSIRRLQ